MVIRLKKVIKKFIKSKKLQDNLRLIYNSLKTFNLNLLKDELRYRKNGLPDNFPFPSSDLIFTIIAIPWVSEYYKSGKLIYDEIISSLAKANIHLKENSNILDFGCGCGRLIRHFANESKFNLYGSDLNPKLINWCKENLHFGNFSTNNVLPPLNYPDNYFDFIYARSVFTHLSEIYQKQWINEIKRILKPNGLFYFTTHGNQTLSNLTQIEKTIFHEKGILEHNFFDEGDNKFSTYQSYKWTKENLISDFELLYFEEGKTWTHLTQDVYIIRKIN
jgi:ubiquinone/menaquinone biosynthesis C-methylase UbiE